MVCEIVKIYMSNKTSTVNLNSLIQDDMCEDCMREAVVNGKLVWFLLRDFRQNCRY